jgi:hypothetical protein
MIINLEFKRDDNFTESLVILRSILKYEKIKSRHAKTSLSALYTRKTLTFQTFGNYDLSEVIVLFLYRSGTQDSQKAPSWG